jgi:hypothetical protein
LQDVVPFVHLGQQLATRARTYSLFLSVLQFSSNGELLTATRASFSLSHPFLLFLLLNSFDWGMSGNARNTHGGYIVDLPCLHRLQIDCQSKERPLVIRHRISKTDLAISPHSWSRTEPLMPHHVHVVPLAQMVSVKKKAGICASCQHARLRSPAIRAVSFVICKAASGLLSPVRPSPHQIQDLYTHTLGTISASGSRALVLHSRSLTSFLFLVMVSAPNS